MLTWIFWKITKVWNIYTSYCASFLFQVFFKILMLIFGLYKRRKKCLPRSNFCGKFFFLKNFIFFYPFECINFQPAGLLKIALTLTIILTFNTCFLTTQYSFKILCLSTKFKWNLCTNKPVLSENWKYFCCANIIYFVLKKKKKCI